MDNILELNKIILFILFIISGVIAARTYELIIGVKKESYQQVIDVFTYSCINYALLLPVIFYFSESYPLIVYSISIFVTPIILATICGWLRTKAFFTKKLPHPIGKPWDFVFSNEKPYWVIVTLENGKKIAGKYGCESFSSSAPHDEQLYLEEAWILNDDGGFDRPINQTAGILITSNKIESVELFKYLEKEG